MLEKIRENLETNEKKVQIKELKSQKSFIQKFETASQKRKREEEELSKTHFKITYKDCLIPDEIFDMPEYQNMKKMLYVKNLPKMVAEFYRRRK